MPKFHFDRAKQPRFGILRPLGNFSGTTPDPHITYEELWKHDEYIHRLPPQVDIALIPKPKKPFFLSKLLTPSSYAQYEVELSEYDAEVLEAEKINRIHALHDLVKKDAGYHCYFCNFKDERYSEIHHIDGNHFNNDKKNLACACTLCHRQHHLLWISVYDHASLGAGKLDFLTQAELNHYQRIAIVMRDDPRFAGVLGASGKLGQTLDMLTKSFARPLHSFMVPDDEKAAQWEQHISSVQLENSSNNNTAYYNQIELALNHLNSQKLSKTEKDAVTAYDNFIGLTELKRIDTNASDDDLRTRQVNLVRECMARFKKAYEQKFEKDFQDNADSFSVFELATALQRISYADFKAFNPPYLYLLYKDHIFSKEQIEYYKTLDYFKVDQWSYGDN